MLLSNTPDYPGKDVEKVFGLVMGNSIRAKNVFLDIGASIKSIVGGELKDYTQLLTEARSEALDRMIQAADKLGANAVINIRISTASIAGGAAEILTYGTAVKVR